VKEFSFLIFIKLLKMKTLSLAVLALVNNVSAIQIGETWTPEQSRKLFEK
jgi:hypothetical protein